VTNGEQSSPLLGDGAAVVVTALINLGLNRIPHGWELPAGIGAAGAMMGLAHLSGADMAGEGLDPGTVDDGLRLGLAVGIPAAALVLAGAAIPAIRKYYHDDRITRATSDDITYHLLARIPFATAMTEEVIFRSALLGVFGRTRGPFMAAVFSSALFGAWHILPTIDRLHTNAGAARLHGTDPKRQALTVASVVAGTALAGMAFCWLQRRSRSVVAPIVVHAALNGSGLLAGWLGARAEAEADAVS
jgi:CAAX protease family protein